MDAKGGRSARRRSADAKAQRFPTCCRPPSEPIMRSGAEYEPPATLKGGAGGLTIKSHIRRDRAWLHRKGSDNTRTGWTGYYCGLVIIERLEIGTRPDRRDCERSCTRAQDWLSQLPLKPTKKVFLDKYLTKT